MILQIVCIVIALLLSVVLHYIPKESAGCAFAFRSVSGIAMLCFVSLAIAWQFASGRDTLLTQVLHTLLIQAITFGVLLVVFRNHIFGQKK